MRMPKEVLAVLEWTQSPIFIREVDDHMEWTEAYTVASDVVNALFTFASGVRLPIYIVCNIEVIDCKLQSPHSSKLVQVRREVRYLIESCKSGICALVHCNRTTCRHGTSSANVSTLNNKANGVAHSTSNDSLKTYDCIRSTFDAPFVRAGPVTASCHQQYCISPTKSASVVTISNASMRSG